MIWPILGQTTGHSAKLVTFSSAGEFIESYVINTSHGMTDFLPAEDPEMMAKLFQESHVDTLTWIVGYDIDTIDDRYH